MTSWSGKLLDSKYVLPLSLQASTAGPGRGRRPARVHPAACPTWCWPLAGGSTGRTTKIRSLAAPALDDGAELLAVVDGDLHQRPVGLRQDGRLFLPTLVVAHGARLVRFPVRIYGGPAPRSEEHTSELQS